MTRLMDEADLETPEVDAAEQAVSAVPAWQDEEPVPGPASAEAGEWDAEENRIVAFDDDYR
ncbi:hypothetical protein [Actinoplanes sp. NPDC020271]|uniref:hypothetical protein n=1 Tax=Actinoplanes sp. NPDC020271 TaxID=3363896 RepID=UPI00379C7FAE